MTENSEAFATPVASVHSVQVGGVAPLGPDGVPSGISKHGVKGPVGVGKLNLEGDQQADLHVHGGPEKAVYAYAAAHYAVWDSEFPALRARLTPGAFGENLTVEGMTEADICAGDVHQIGTARLQVAQPRQPCFKLALWFDNKSLPRAMIRSGRSGWYYRVLEEGTLAPGDVVRLVERPNPRLRFDRLVAFAYRGHATKGDLLEIAKADGVTEWLRSAAERYLRAS